MAHFVELNLLGGSQVLINVANIISIASYPGRHGTSISVIGNTREINVKENYQQVKQLVQSASK